VDWESDSHGEGHVCKEKFLDSIFELGHTWARDVDDDGDISAKEILEYLEYMVRNIFVYILLCYSLKSMCPAL
jgi:hypothetical protein